jgi:OmpA family protein
MKKVSVIVIAIVGLVFAGYAEAAKPKRRSRNANRIGPYAGLLVGQTSYTSDHSEDEADLESAFEDVDFQNLRISTKDSDIGYHAVFGYRFSRYVAGEFGLAQFGDLATTARADVNLDGEGFLPASIKVGYSVGGPALSVLGMLPINDKFEFFGRAGVLFASSEREVLTRIDGEATSFGSSKGDSAEMILGLGVSYHFNQMYSVRAEFQKMDGVGESQRTPQQDLAFATLGFLVRF